MFSSSSGRRQKKGPVSNAVLRPAVGSTTNLNCERREQLYSNQLSTHTHSYASQEETGHAQSSSDISAALSDHHCLTPDLRLSVWSPGETPASDQLSP